MSVIHGYAISNDGNVAAGWNSHAGSGHAGIKLMPAIPKPRPAALERKDRRTAQKSADEAENKKVRARSGGCCEARFDTYDVADYGDVPNWHRFAFIIRCPRKAIHIHHMISGIGVRARGRSALAQHKQHICAKCHSEIHSHIYKRVGGPVPLWTDCYERVK